MCTIKKTRKRSWTRIHGYDGVKETGNKNDVYKCLGQGVLDSPSNIIVRCIDCPLALPPISGMVLVREQFDDGLLLRVLICGSQESMMWYTAIHVLCRD
jgi:hypothetical protein